MDMTVAKERLDAYEKHLFAFNHAMAVMITDAETAAPSESFEARGVSMGVLSEEMFKYSTDPENIALIEEIYEHRDEADPELARRSELLMKQLKELRCIPMDEYVGYNQLLNESNYVWLKAKANNDFASFAPYIRKIIDTMKHFAELTDPGKDPYDVALDSHEEGTSKEYYDAYFNEVKAVLVPLIAKINACEQPDTSWLEVSYPIDQQRKFSQLVMDAFRIDKTHCTIGETEHPFTNGSCSQDVRITTHYHEHAPVSSLYSVIHEGGHANYELHVNPDYDYNCLGGGCSTALHESQSRFWENYVGRSREFTGWLWDTFKELFPEQCEGHTAEDFYRGINKAQPSLIRTEADELTYSMHIIIRYEIEKKLFSGELEVEDIPAEWARLYKEYLGVDVPDDTRGALQDVHWSQGSIGYFPTYSLGTAYSAQILDTMRKDLDVDALLAKDDVQPIMDWLTEKLYRFGSLPKPGDVIPAITGKPFTAKYYTDYLTKKFSELYGL